MVEDIELPEQRLRFVFDVAGVLLNFDPDVVLEPLFQNTGRSLDVFHTEICGSEFHGRISRGDEPTLVIEETCRRYPDWEQEIRLWESRFDDMLTGSLEGTVSVVEELKERNHRVYLLGNWHRNEFVRAALRFDFLNWFDDVLLSSDCGVLKPDPEIFALAEQQFELQPADTVFIDDREDNVRAALDRNWNGIVFESERHLYLTLMDSGIL